MVVEKVDIPIKEGCAQEFEQSMIEGRKVLLDASGSHSVALSRGVENPEKYLLLVEWSSVEDHVAFTKTAGIDRFREIIGPFLDGKPAMEHFSPVD